VKIPPTHRNVLLLPTVVIAVCLPSSSLMRYAAPRVHSSGVCIV